MVRETDADFEIDRILGGETEPGTDVKKGRDLAPGVGWLDLAPGVLSVLSIRILVAEIHGDVVGEGKPHADSAADGISGGHPGQFQTVAFLGQVIFAEVVGVPDIAECDDRIDGLA